MFMLCLSSHRITNIGGYYHRNFLIMPSLRFGEWMNFGSHKHEDLSKNSGLIGWDHRKVCLYFYALLSLIDCEKGEYYTQLHLSKIPRNPSLQIPVPPTLCFCVTSCAHVKHMPFIFFLFCPCVHFMPHLNLYLSHHNFKIPLIKTGCIRAISKVPTCQLKVSSQKDSCHCWILLEYFYILWIFYCRIINYTPHYKFQCWLN